MEKVEEGEKYMKMFILFCNGIIPMLMIYLGIICNKQSAKKTNKILNIFMPITSDGSGVGHIPNCDSLRDKILLKKYRRRLSIIWSLSGILTLIITAIVLIMNKTNILSTANYIDINSVTVIMLEIELAIVVVIFAIIKFILKRDFYKQKERQA